MAIRVKERNISEASFVGEIVEAQKPMRVSSINEYVMGNIIDHDGGIEFQEKKL